MNVAIIPARAGSKSIINKNLQKIGTKSLVDMTIESAKSSGVFSHIILSTDIPTLIEDHQKSDITVRDRPRDLCSDKSIMSEVTMDCINHYAIPNDACIWLLQPTSPFRVRADYRNISEVFKSSDCQSVISVMDVSAHHPERMYTITKGVLYPMKHGDAKGAHLPFRNKQDLPEVFIRSGHYYAFKCQAFKKFKNFYIKPCRPYIIEKLRAINIDDHVDLRIARVLAQEGIYQ